MDIKRFGVSFCALAIATSLPGCATLDQAGDRYGRPAVGCVVGAGLGALIGGALGGKDGAIKGGLAGGAIGCVAGLAWEKRDSELKRIAAEERMKLELRQIFVSEAQDSKQQLATHREQERQRRAGLVAEVTDEGMFAPDSDRLTPQGERQLTRMAELFRAAHDGDAKQKNAPILIVGHTDATGSAEHNQGLSERRAHNVAQVLAKAGLSPQHLYFQGAGESRPIADNTSDAGRAKNRRVEIMDVESLPVLQREVRRERNNARYLAYGTKTDGELRAQEKSTQDTSSAPTSAPNPRPAEKPKVAQMQKSGKRAKPPAYFTDFGGKPTAQDSWNLADLVHPRTEGGFSVIATAFASEIPINSCLADQPRVAGEVKNFATGAALEHPTTDYLPGMNGRAWAERVNGHTVVLNPVAVLADEATVAKAPKVQLIRAGQTKKQTVDMTATANAYDGENALLYRAFVTDAESPVVCVDVVLSKTDGKAASGKLYYDRAGTAYVAPYTPKRH